MDPVARVWDVLDVSAGEQPLDFWVILGAETKGKTRREDEYQVKQVTEGLKKTSGPQLYECKLIVAKYVIYSALSLYCVE